MHTLRIVQRIIQTCVNCTTNYTNTAMAIVTKCNYLNRSYFDLLSFSTKLFIKILQKYFVTSMATICIVWPSVACRIQSRKAHIYLVGLDSFFVIQMVCWPITEGKSLGWAQFGLQTLCFVCVGWAGDQVYTNSHLLISYFKKKSQL